MKIHLGDELARASAGHISALVEAEVASRIYDHDYSLWGKDAAAEAEIRLGWTNAAQNSLDTVPEILRLRDKFQSLGLGRIVLCGMGGSSLAPEVICKSDDVPLIILDSTSPAQVSAALMDLEHTVVVVSSKSGGTVETDSLKRIFEKSFSDLGIEPTERIVIVTDPNSPLHQSAIADGYQVFEADPNVGGRYSALTAFGLVPAGLAGADIAKLLASAVKITAKLAFDSLDNPATILAAALYDEHRDKFALSGDSGAIRGFGDWVEQLVAESTGKSGVGVLPVVISNQSYEAKNTLVDVTLVTHSSELPNANQVCFSGELGELFQLWSTATAMLGWLLEINPFDQPDVESAKIASRAFLDTSSGTTESSTNLSVLEFSHSGYESSATDLASAVADLLNEVDNNSYLSLQMYLSREHFSHYEILRDVLAEKIQRPVTLGWGPRFLHSTGQYHKGGRPQGVFLQLTTQEQELAIPGREFGFQALINSQAAGDASVLRDHSRPVLTIRLAEPALDLKSLRELIG